MNGRQEDRKEDGRELSGGRVGVEGREEGTRNQVRNGNKAWEDEMWEKEGRVCESE